MAIAPRAQRGGVSALGASAPNLPANFGQDQIVGRDILSLAEPIMRHVQRVQTRQDTIEAARIRQQFSEFSQAELVRLSAEQDFSREETFNAYRASLMNRKRDLITNAPLTADGRAKVDAELTNIMGVGVAEGAQLRVAEQNRIVAQSLSTQVGAIVADVARDPTVPLPDRLMEIDASIREYEPALTPDQTAALRTAATGQVVEAYMQPLVETVDTEGLRVMLNDPVVRNALGPEQYRTLSSQLRVQELKKAQDAATRQVTMDRLTAAGVDVSNPRIALALEGLNPDAIFPTSGSVDPKIRQWQFLVGQGETPDRATELVFGRSDGGASGAGTARERAQSTMTGFGNRINETPQGTSPAMTFTELSDAITTIHAEARGNRNETTGVVTPGNVPVAALMALERAGISLDEVRQDPAAAAMQAAINLGVPLPVSMRPDHQPGAAAWTPAAAAPTTPMVGATPPGQETPAVAVAPPEQVATPATFGPLATIGGDPEAGDPQAINNLMQPSLDYLGSSGIDDPPPAPPFSLYGLADLIANPIERLMAVPGLLPGSSPTEKQAAIFAARENAKLSWFSLTEGLRTSPRFADAERQELQRLLSGINPDRWVTNPGAFRADLTGVSNFLVRRYQHHQRILERDAQARTKGRSGQPAEQIRASQSMLNAMEWAIETIGYQDVDGNVLNYPTVVTEGILSPEEEAELRELEALEAQGRSDMGLGAP